MCGKEPRSSPLPPRSHPPSHLPQRERGRQGGPQLRCLACLTVTLLPGVVSSNHCTSEQEVELARYCRGEFTVSSRWPRALLWDLWLWGGPEGRQAFLHQTSRRHETLINEATRGWRFRLWRHTCIWARLQIKVAFRDWIHASRIKTTSSSSLSNNCLNVFSPSETDSMCSGL